MPNKIVKNSIIRKRFKATGRVQGVGFRPFVHRLASELGLVGLVGNDTHGAFIEVEGQAEKIEAFLLRLKSELPPIAKIFSLSAENMPPQGENSFHILSSLSEGTQDVEITPDVSICDDCLGELFNPNDRRYRYPFINCTNCGPRYSIIRGVPYDRANTTMSVFEMCDDCRCEYEDPANRRFHAQPNACPVCGPKVWLIDNKSKETDGGPIKKCVKLLKQGKIVAIKGIGGFHLACRADDDKAVITLREKKGREAKPLAMMAGSLEDASQIAEIDDASLEALVSPIRPIVLVKKRKNAKISKYVAPASDCFGIMLPYSPLHYLIFSEKPGTLVMTSGNPSEEPLCGNNEEAIQRLSSIADYFLLHNRDIEHRVDDSVVRSYAIGTGSAITPFRRSRGYVPGKIRLLNSTEEIVLAVGGEMKSVVCLMNGSDAVLSEHLGELENPEAYRNFINAIDSLKTLLKLEPSVVAYDMHPDYSSTRYAKQLTIKKTAIQHHHAHIISCMADNGINGRVIGVACDGTGYGTDGSIWGCEILICDEISFERNAYLLPYPLIGGDYAARETWRPAAGILRETFGDGWRRAAEFAFRQVDKKALDLAEIKLNSNKRIIKTSSLGRLFDAVAFLLGICSANRYEAEAAMALEAAASESGETTLFKYSILDESGSYRLDYSPMIKEIINMVKSGELVQNLARAFHETIAAMLADGICRVADKSGLNRVAFSGGCFANRILLENLATLLKKQGFDIFFHRNIPTGDGGIALGQAVIAAERAKRGCL